MGYFPKEEINDTNYKILAKNSLKTTLRLLKFIGRPLYLIFSYSFIAIVFAFYLAKNIITLSVPWFLHLVSQVKKSLTKKGGNIFEVRQKGTSFRKKIISLLAKTFTKFILPSFILIIHCLVSASKIFLTTVVEIKNLILLPFLKIKLKLVSKKRPSSRARASKTKAPEIRFVRIALTTFILLTSVFAFSFWWFILKDLPSPVQLKERDLEASTKIYDRNGNLLYKIYKDKNRTPVALNEVPKHVIYATLSIEDDEFYSHPGFSIKGIVRAIVENAKEGKLTGGSTITQQLVKNTLLTSEKTLIRKLRELTLAIMVELTYDKDEILEMYLNEVSYGGTACGIQEAARTYFDKDVEQLNLAEAALLAGLPKSPTSFSPFGAHPEKTLARQNEVLNLMQKNGYISEEQKASAEKQEIKLAENKTEISAPHFVMYVKKLLEEKYSKELVEKGGLEVITSLDINIQKLAENVVSQEVEKLKNLNVGNGAALVINPKTGEVLAMVGSTNYFATEAGGNVNVVTRPRQPGSSIKIVNYAYALSNGFTAASIIPDSPVTFLVDGQPPYTPKNYDGGFRGNLTLRSAFAESRNVPAVRVLSTYGVANMIAMGRKMGITSWQDPKNYGLSLTLGGGEVTLLELANAYATVANYGKKPEINPIIKITNQKGKVLEENGCIDSQDSQAKLVNLDHEDNLINSPAPNRMTLGINLVNSVYATESALNLKGVKKSSCETEQVLDPEIAFILTDILKDNNARAPAFGFNSLLNIPGHAEVAVKTGTSNNLRDNVAVGYNQNFLVASWVGNNDNSMMSRIASGVTGATPIFNKIMSSLLADKENHDWEIPSGLEQVAICSLTGTLPCTGCPTKLEWFVAGNIPKMACNPEQFKKEEVKPVDQVAQEPQGLPRQNEVSAGRILPEAARIEIIDKRKSKKFRPFLPQP